MLVLYTNNGTAACDAMRVSLLVSRLDGEIVKMAKQQAPIRSICATESFCHHAVDFQSEVPLASLCGRGIMISFSAVEEHFRALCVS